MPQSPGTSTAVTVFGEEFRIKGDMPEAEVLEVARHVDARMRALASRNPRLSFDRLAVLAALNIAADLLRSEAHCRDLDRQLQERWRNLKDRKVAKAP